MISSCYTLNTFCCLDPAEHVFALHRQLKEEEKSHKQTLKSISELDIKHQEELQKRIDQLLQENEEKLAAEIEKIRLVVALCLMT